VARKSRKVAFLACADLKVAFLNSGRDARRSGPRLGGVQRGPGETGVPLGVVLRLDRQAMRFDGGRVLIGGAPPRMMQLSAAATARLVDRSLTVSDPTSAALARTLLDAGIAHPVEVPAGAVPPAAEVTVVVPVKDRTDGLRRLLAALPGLRVIVVDDGSADPDAVAAVAGRAGARLLRRERSGGPAAARNAGLAAAGTGLVAFLDSDVVPEPGWLDPLLAAFADPAVGLVAPRVVALDPGRGWLDRYEAVRSSLDLGPDPALVVPRTRVAYVPSAAVVVRREAAAGGFDERMRVAEDVDLVLRLHATGWRLRYEPAARVGHDHRTRLLDWWLRKAYYGTGAAPLALRHPGSVPPMVLSPSGAAIAGLTLLARPRTAVAGALAVLVVSTARLSRQLGAMPRPRGTSARLVGLGAVGALAQTADAVTRHHWPLSVVAALVSARARRRVLAIAVAEGLVDWWRHRDRDPRVRTGPLGHLLARRLDDLGYGAGLWWGALRHRTVEPLRPIGAGAASRSARPAGTGPTRPEG
jgi:mycofactocin system glycosyltransferase